MIRVEYSPERTSHAIRANSLTRRAHGSTWILSGGLAVALAAAAVSQKPAYTEWSDYAGGPAGLQYSALRQINKSNVAQLEKAWFYPVPGTSARFGYNPLVRDGVMYILGEEDAIIALNAATGKKIWTHRTEGRPTD